ncbi:eCIS core domain-containing protein [Tumebacillus algifaecis]|uniref:eCIS core domain-containing protein n=1 Tax=Tumebacillus algifaecis TaxID=1214604 RepID=UPI0012FD6A31|nr:DUF4157 domain-containing protein [Tumebacillus algifaecis]
MARKMHRGIAGISNTSQVKQKKKAAQVNTGSPIQSTLMQMQRSYGNQATTRFLSGQIQRKALQMSALEEEELQLKQDPAQRMAMDEEELQLKADPAQRMALDEEELQMKPAAPLQRSASSSKMPEDVQLKMETAMNADFSDVEIHEGDEASKVGALAVAQGKDIYFARGQYQPDTQTGQELLGHELKHVDQQAKGLVQPTTTVGGLPVNDDPKLEQDADEVGRKAASLKL